MISKKKVPLTCERLKKALPNPDRIEYVQALLPGGDHVYIDGSVPENFVKILVRYKRTSYQERRGTSRATSVRSTAPISLNAAMSSDSQR